jgi:RimJ/RimL family protein N-acetyltransferase
MIEQEGRPIGWIQWYFWADYPEHAQNLAAEPQAAGIDVAIGELDMTGWGLGPVAVREFLKRFILTKPTVRAVTTDPEEGNRRSLRAFEKAGFTVAGTVQLAGESCKRQVIRLDRA